MEPTPISRSYSFEEAVRESIAAENASDHLDLGPVDTLDPAALKREYDAFYGTSPLNSPSPSPSPSRPVSPDAEARERLCGERCGLSPLSTPPQSPPSSRPTTPVPVMQLPSPPTQPSSPPGAPINSKNRRNRKKGGKRRCLKRKADRDSQDKNATPHPRSLKRIKRADSTQTSYDTGSIPSTSAGFVARRDTEGGRTANTKALLQDPFFRLIKHQEGCAVAPAKLDLALTLAILD